MCKSNHLKQRVDQNVLYFVVGWDYLKKERLKVVDNFPLPSVDIISKSRSAPASQICSLSPYIQLSQRLASNKCGSGSRSWPWFGGFDPSVL